MYTFQGRTDRKGSLFGGKVLSQLSKEQIDYITVMEKAIAESSAKTMVKDSVHPITMRFRDLTLETRVC